MAFSFLIWVVEHGVGPAGEVPLLEGRWGLFVPSFSAGRAVILCGQEKRSCFFQRPHREGTSPFCDRRAGGSVPPVWERPFLPVPNSPSVKAVFFFFLRGGDPIARVFFPFCREVLRLQKNIFFPVVGSFFPLLRFDISQKDIRYTFREYGPSHKGRGPLRSPRCYFSFPIIFFRCVGPPPLLVRPAPFLSDTILVTVSSRSMICEKETPPAPAEANPLFFFFSFFFFFFFFASSWAAFLFVLGMGALYGKHFFPFPLVLHAAVPGRLSHFFSFLFVAHVVSARGMLGFLLRDGGSVPSSLLPAREKSPLP